MSSWAGKRLYTLLVALVLLFFGSQFFALERLMQSSREQRVDISNALWIAAQLETEFMRFLGALDRYAANRDQLESEDLRRRFDILISRLPMFLEGRTGKLFGHVSGAQDSVRSLQATIERLEEDVLAYARGGSVDYGVLRGEFDGHQRAIHKMVLDTFLTDEAVTAQFQERSERGYWLVIATLCGALVSGGLLVVALVRQIRRAEAAEAKARREGDKAVEADQAKSEFLAHMSHELRTPLNAIVGFTEAIKHELMGPLGNDRYRTYIASIHDSAMLLVRLVGDILDLSKIEAGKYELNERSLDLAEVARGSIRMCLPQAESDGLTVDADFAAGLPQLYGDPDVLRQIVLNLLSNAIKFTPPGGRVSVSLAMNAGGAMVLAVSDSGIGIAKADLELALAPFGQVANVMTRSYAGTGLGLPLAKSLVELHDGTMEIDSALGEGTRVTVTLPPSRLIRTALAA